MSTNIFDFWADVSANAERHPADAEVFRRLGVQSQAGVLPNPFFGPLKTARVVLLYLSPGLRDDDRHLSMLETVQTYAQRQRSGNAPLPSQEDYEPTWNWWRKRVGQLQVEPAEMRERIAFLNICAYRSKTFDTPYLLSALPSSRTALDWAQSVLFPEAERGDCVVVCLRAAAYWGLATGDHGKALFVPPVNRSGFMLHGETRFRVVEAVKAAVG